MLRQKFLLALFLVLSILIMSGNSWATQVSLPHALFEGFMQTYTDNGSGDELFFIDTTISSVVLLDGSMTVNDPIVGSMVTVSGQRTGAAFTDATFAIGSYFSATLTDINFTTDGTQWFLNPGLDSNDPLTWNLSDIVLNPNGSDYILDLASVLGPDNRSGMKMTLDVFDGSLSGDSTSFVQGLIAAPVPPAVPEPVSSTLFVIGGATLGFRRFRKRK